MIGDGGACVSSTNTQVQWFNCYFFPARKGYPLSGSTKCSKSSFCDKEFYHEAISVRFTNFQPVGPPRPLTAFVLDTTRRRRTRRRDRRGHCCSSTSSRRGRGGAVERQVITGGPTGDKQSENPEGGVRRTTGGVGQL